MLYKFIFLWKNAVQDREWVRQIKRLTIVVFMASSVGDLIMMNM